MRSTRYLSLAFAITASTYLVPNSAQAVYSTTDGMPGDVASDVRHTHFSKAEWDASNYAPKEDVRC